MTTFVAKLSSPFTLMRALLADLFRIEPIELTEHEIVSDLEYGRTDARHQEPRADRAPPSENRTPRKPIGRGDPVPPTGIVARASDLRGRSAS